jgi:hypothetical protein
VFTYSWTRELSHEHEESRSPSSSLGPQLLTQPRTDAEDYEEVGVARDQPFSNFAQATIKKSLPRASFGLYDMSLVV